jgi:hypothetical protein
VAPCQIWVQKLDGSKKRLLDSTSYSRRGGNRVARRQVDRVRRDRALRSGFGRPRRSGIRSRACRTTPAATSLRVTRADIFVVPITGGQPPRCHDVRRNESEPRLVARTGNGSRSCRRRHASRRADLRRRRRRRRAGEIVRTLAVRARVVRVVPTGDIASRLRSAAVGMFRLDPRHETVKELIGGAAVNGFAYDAAKKTWPTSPRVWICRRSSTSRTPTARASASYVVQRQAEQRDRLVHGERFTYPSVAGSRSKGGS